LNYRATRELQPVAFLSQQLLAHIVNMVAKLFMVNYSRNIPVPCKPMHIAPLLSVLTNELIPVQKCEATDARLLPSDFALKEIRLDCRPTPQFFDFVKHACDFLFRFSVNWSGSALR
jgi:hypothetical protein